MNGKSSLVVTQRLAVRVPKTGATIEQCEDAYAVDANVAAISDGASTQFESRLWARLLADSFVQRPPFDLNREQLLNWVDEAAAQWSAAIPWPDLNVFESTKAERGSAATLAGVRLDPSLSPAADGRWRCLTLGDSCLFHVSNDRLLTATPIDKSADFDLTPALLSTQRAISERYIDKRVVQEGTWQVGDELWLLTDSIAQWFLREAERDGMPWATLAALDKESLPLWVANCRAKRLMRDDDVTVVRLALAAPGMRDDRTTVPKRRQPLLTGPGRTGPGRAGARRAGTGPGRTGLAQPGPVQPEPTRDNGGRLGRITRNGSIRKGPILIGIAIFAAFVLGFAVRGGGSTPPSNQGRHDKHHTRINLEKEAGDFLSSLMTFRADDFSGYKAALTHLSTGSLASSLPKQLGLSPTAAYSSSGQPISIMMLPGSGSTRNLFAVVRQTVTDVSTRHNSSRLFLIKLVMVRSGKHWLVADVTFVRSPASFLPASRHAAHQGQHHGGQHGGHRQGTVSPSPGASTPHSSRSPSPSP